MDIHRGRFFPYPTQPITALAFTHPSDPTSNAPTDLRLALGRENGDVEIWNPLGGKWLQESILRGSTGKSVDRLAWTHEYEVEEQGITTVAKPGRLRLFSTDSSKVISEWDVSNGTVKRYAESNFGDLWCFAAQPGFRVPKDGKVENAPPAQLLVGGCGDGSVVLFSTEDDDLRCLRLLVASPAKRAKVLSITWRDRNTVVAGYDDSMIRVIDVNERRIIRSMSLGKSPEGGHSIVWALKCLPDGTILSGDSTGELKIWDARNFSSIQRLKTHQADIQDIVSNARGDLIFTVAVDRRTVAYKPIVSQQGKKSQRWMRLMHRRYHDHDIKCAAAYESMGLSFLVSGGVDATPISLPMANWQTEYHRSLSHLPQQPQMSVSPNQRLILTWWNRDLHIYHVPRRHQDGTAVVEMGLETRQNFEQLATLRLSGDEHIQSAQISKDGHSVVASTASGVRLFQLRLTKSNGRMSLRTRPAELPASLGRYAARHVGFSPDGHWLVAIRPDNTILLAKVIAADNLKDRPTIHKKLVRLSRNTRNQDSPGLGDYTTNINTFTFSPESRVLATGDLSGHVDVFVLEGQEDLDYSLSESSSSSSGPDSDSDSDSNSDDESESPIIHGQRWQSTPQDSFFLRLDAAILALTFRPLSGAESSSPKTAILHPTRHNPHPIAFSSPSSTKLVAITANHSIVELDVLTGRLTDWSRRNPSSLLPQKFTRLRDRIMGVFWDVNDGKERLWMWGVNWLFMLDLRYDFPAVHQNRAVGQSDDKPLHAGAHNTAGSTKKRKRRLSHSRKELGKGTGAGDSIKHSDRTATGYSSLGIKYRDWEGEVDAIELDRRLEPDPDEDKYTGGEALVNLRRGMEDVQMGDVGEKDADDTHDEDVFVKKNNTIKNDSQHQNGHTGADVVKSKDSQPQNKFPFWGTQHYRSIFGVGVLSETTSPSTGLAAHHAAAQPTDVAMVNGTAHPDLDIDHNAKNEATPTNAQNGSPLDILESPNSLEIILVERPMHDVDLPPRFDGGQDWDA